MDQKMINVIIGTNDTDVDTESKLLATNTNNITIKMHPSLIGTVLFFKRKAEIKDNSLILPKTVRSIYTPTRSTAEEFYDFNDLLGDDEYRNSNTKSLNEYINQLKTLVSETKLPIDVHIGGDDKNFEKTIKNHLLYMNNKHVAFFEDDYYEELCQLIKKFNKNKIVFIPKQNTRFINTFVTIKIIDIDKIYQLIDYLSKIIA